MKMIPARTHGVLRYAIFVALLLALALVTGAAVPRVAAASVARGIVDPILTQWGTRFDPAVQEEALDQIGPGLRASYVRYVVSWADAQPADKDHYVETYLAGVDNAVSLAKARGLKVMITYSYVPRWASDDRYWAEVGGYDRKIAMKTDEATLDAFQEFCRAMAERWQGVWGYECWNEPNLHLTLYPQSTATDKDFGAHVYLKMLRRFSAGVDEGDPAAQRLAGGTAPRGYKATDRLSSRKMMTSPQRFAAAIKAARPSVSPLFDGYSHHPYTPGSAAKKWPEALPRDPTTTVNLGNLSTLLKMFPTKKFYLTEYGYQTAACYAFSQDFVSYATQADYLKRAYAFAARYRQVKLLMWFLLDDYSPTGESSSLNGFYTGLRDVHQAKKPAWYAFARGNHLTLAAPASAKKGTTVSAQGTLSSDTAGPVSGAKLVVRSRTASGRPWTKVATRVTGADGSYSVSIRLARSAYFRVEWTGVVTGQTRRIIAN